MNILITGATGNVGRQIVRYLSEIKTKRNKQYQVIIADRDIDRAKTTFANVDNLSYRHFDFDDTESFTQSFEGIDIMFLLRPPEITDNYHKITGERPTSLIEFIARESHMFVH